MDIDDGINQELLRWYAQFSDGHDELKTDLQKKLAECGTLPPPEIVSCPELEAYYARFNHEHEEQREQLFERLRETVPAVSPQSTRREWLVGTVPRIAASLLIAAAGGGLLLNSFSRPAYAIEDIVHRVHTTKRLYMRGSIRGQFPFEVYIERPNMFRVTNHQLTTVKDKVIYSVSGHRASNGRVRYLHEDIVQGGRVKDLPYYESPYAEEDHPIWSQIETESLISNALGEEYLFQDAAGFALKKQQKIEGTTCDFFERQVAENSIQRLIVDSRSGRPMRATGVRFDPRTQSEGITWKIDEIDMNLLGPPDHIRFKHFEPSELGPRPSPVERFSKMSAPPGAFVPFGLRIGQFCLTCWTADDTVVGQPWFRVEESRDDATENLGTSHDGTSEWNWVLVQLPNETLSARIVVEYDMLNLGSLTSRRMKLKRQTPIDIGAAGVEEVLKHMATPEEAQRILTRVRGRMPQA